MVVISFFQHPVTFIQRATVHVNIRRPVADEVESPGAADRQGTLKPKKAAAASGTPRSGLPVRWLSEALRGGVGESRKP